MKPKLPKAQQRAIFHVREDRFDHCSYIIMVSIKACEWEKGGNRSLIIPHFIKIIYTSSR